MIYFTAHTFKCVCHCRRAMFRVLGMYNFATGIKAELLQEDFFFLIHLFARDVLVVEKFEIEETKHTFIVSVSKVEY